MIPFPLLLTLALGAQAAAPTTRVGPLDYPVEAMTFANLTGARELVLASGGVLRGGRLEGQALTPVWEDKLPGRPTALGLGAADLGRGWDQLFLSVSIPGEEGPRGWIVSRRGTLDVLQRSDWFYRVIGGKPYAQRLQDSKQVPLSPIAEVVYEKARYRPGPSVTEDWLYAWTPGPSSTTMSVARDRAFALNLPDGPRQTQEAYAGTPRRVRCGDDFCDFYAPAFSSADGRKWLVFQNIPAKGILSERLGRYVDAKAYELSVASGTVKETPSAPLGGYVADAAADDAGIWAAVVTPAGKTYLLRFDRP